MRRAQTAVAALVASLAAAAAAEDPLRLIQDAYDLNTTRSSVAQGAGARAFGMGGAFLARPDDATAASWNPAGLSYLRLPEVSLVGTGGSLEILTSIPLPGSATERFTNLANRQSGSGLDFLAGTWPVRLGGTTGAVQLSYQRVISFDGNNRREEFRLNSPTTVRDSDRSGGFDVIALGTGLQVARGWRVGFTLNRWRNGYRFDIDRQGQDQLGARQFLEFDLSGWNSNLGLIYSPSKSLNLGAVYKRGFTAHTALSRSRVDSLPSGVILSTNHFAVPDPSHPDTPVGSLDFPATYGVGLSIRPSTPLTISADYTRTRWSQARIRNYFTLGANGTPTPQADPEDEEDFFSELQYPTLIRSRAPQVDTQQYRLGAEYVVIKGAVKWPLRAGLFLDGQLFQTLDDKTGLRDRTPLYRGITVGTGIVIDQVLIDFAYIHQWGSYREVDPASLVEQDNTVRSNRFLVSLIYRRQR